ncbi:MAG: hypothetical protein J6V23_01790 [Bacteroidaceae bacterium]|jgi:hypothetical protein|nr:hypothetical protein [Bacteroidaceae bacterium]
MKKLFVALMAVLVLASCAEKEKSPADVMMMTVEVMNVAAEKLEAATTSDEVIAAITAMNDEMENLDEKYESMLEGYEDEEIIKMYPEAAEALNNAATNWAIVLIGKTQSIEFTPEQEQMIIELLGDGM